MSQVLGRRSYEYRESQLLSTQVGLAQTNGAGDFTVGFAVTISETITIDRYDVLWTPTLASETVKVSMWDPSNNLIVASVAQLAITTGGIHRLPLAAAIQLTAGVYTMGCREITGTRYQRTSTGSFTANRDYGNGMIMATPNLFVAGDGRPTTPAGSERYGYFAARRRI